MRYTVIFDRDAESDLISIHEHIAEARGALFASEFVGRIVAHCEAFGGLPHRGTRRDEVRPGLRTVGWRRTVTIAFEVLDEARRVNILGVFYRGRDVLAALQTRSERG